MQAIDNQKNVPGFIIKLWHMLEDPETDDIICWSRNGDAVQILDETKFCYDLLPLHFKHNRLSSFTRQLNIYGFHKPAGVLNQDENNAYKSDHVFIHPYFKKGRIKLLSKITRKISSKIAPVNNNDFMNDYQQFKKAFNDAKSICSRQQEIDLVVHNLKQENAVLWQEVAVLRQKHQKQQHIVNKLIQFLVTIVQPPNRVDGLKRRPILIHTGSGKKLKPNFDGPTIHELDNSDTLDSEVVPMDKNKDEDIQNSDVLLLTQLQEPEDTNSSPTSQINSSFEVPLENFIDSDQTSTDCVTNDSLLPSLISDNYHNVEPNTTTNYNVELNTTTSNVAKDDILEQDYGADNMSLATCSNNSPIGWTGVIEDIDNNVGLTQNELEQIKKIFSGCNSVDSKYLLQLFNDVPSYGLTPSENWDSLGYTGVGTELTPYDPGLLDFNKLLDDSVDYIHLDDLPVDASNQESINTPDVPQMKSELSFDT